MIKISIVTVTFNCVNSIEKTILSVLRQKYNNIEYIIIDGNSTDGTLDIIKKYSQHLSYWISEPDSGIYYAMNKGIKIATGDWIYFLNSGDVLNSDETINNIPFTNYSNLSNIGGIIGRVKVRTTEGIVDWRHFCPFYRNNQNSYSMGFSHQGVFIKTKLAKTNPFNTSFRLCADFNQMKTIYNNGYNFSEQKIVIACIERRFGASVNNRIVQFKEEAKVLGKEYTIRFKIYYLILVLKSWLRQ